VGITKTLRKWRIDNGEWRMGGKMDNGEWIMENGEWGKWGIENDEWGIG
jgi:hypothetical protein